MLSSQNRCKAVLFGQGPTLLLVLIPLAIVALKVENVGSLLIATPNGVS